MERFRDYLYCPSVQLQLRSVCTQGTETTIRHFGPSLSLSVGKSARLHTPSTSFYYPPVNLKRCWELQAVPLEALLNKPLRLEMCPKSFPQPLLLVSIHLLSILSIVKCENVNFSLKIFRLKLPFYQLTG